MKDSLHLSYLIHNPYGGKMLENYFGVFYVADGRSKCM